MNQVALADRAIPTSAIDMPDTTVNAREAFGIDMDMQVPAFSTRTEHVPDVDPADALVRNEVEHYSEEAAEEYVVRDKGEPA